MASSRVQLNNYISFSFFHKKLAFSTLLTLSTVLALEIRKNVPENPYFILNQPSYVKNLNEQSSTRLPKVFSHPRVYRCQDEGRELVVNFVNINYPDNDIEGDLCKFRLFVTSPKICQIRIDFVDTEMHQPIRGDCITQRFEIEGSAWKTGIPALCGKLNDDHFYLHLEPWLTNSTFIDFKLTTIRNRESFRLGVWLTQIDCSKFNVLKAPEGCSQYFLGENGILKSFNYDGSQYLNGQDFRICIRPALGICGIRYEAKNKEFGLRKSINAGSKSLKRDLYLKSGAGASTCGTDYLLIPDGTSTWGNNRKSKLFFKKKQVFIQASPNRRITKKSDKFGSYDRFCGGLFSSKNGGTTTQPVYSKLHGNLITLFVHTSESADTKFLRLKGQSSTSIGYRLTYHQLRDCRYHRYSINRNQATNELVSRPKLQTLLQALESTSIATNPYFLSTTNNFRNKLFEYNIKEQTQHLLSTFKTKLPLSSTIKPSSISLLKHISNSSETNSPAFTNNSYSKETSEESLIWDYLDYFNEDDSENNYNF